MKISDLSPRARYVLMRNRARMSLPVDAHCRSCGNRDPLHLSRRHKRVLCRNCLAIKHGRGLTDEHHLGGRPSPARTTAVTPNRHAELTPLQEAFWRRNHQPGSVYAVAFDAGALWALKILNDGDPPTS